MRRILGLANTYTQSRFVEAEFIKTGSPTQLIFIAASNMVQNKFADLSEFDLVEAFEMYAAQQLDTDAKTFYGKFDVNVLGKILAAYKKFKNKVVFHYEKELQLEQGRKESELKDELNAKTAADVAKKYRILKDTYQNIGTSESSEIFVFSHKELQQQISSSVYAFWAKILLRANLINYTDEQKARIWEQAKEQSKAELAKSVLSDNYSSAQKVGFKKSLKLISEGKSDDSHYLNSKKIYSKLLIIKSIL